MYEQTTTALLEGLNDSANAAVWNEFDSRYRPILIGFARRLGLDEQDAHDAAQESISRFLSAYRAGKYQRERGRLRSWIIGIARNCVRETQLRGRHDPARRGSSAVDEHPDEQTLVEFWETECQRAILQRSLHRLRHGTGFDEKTILAFEEVVLRERAPAEVAESMGLSRNEVYLAKHRCLTKLREMVAQSTAIYTADDLGGLDS